MEFMVFRQIIFSKGQYSFSVSQCHRQGMAIFMFKQNFEDIQA